VPSGPISDSPLCCQLRPGTIQNPPIPYPVRVTRSSSRAFCFAATSAGQRPHSRHPPTSAGDSLGLSARHPPTSVEMSLI
jgi:hypothetical protein